MKKICIPFVLILFCLLGCMDPRVYCFNADEIMEKVSRIELVECTNDNPKKIIVNENTIPSFDFSKVSIIQDLKEEKFEDFLNELSLIRFHVENESVNSPVGYAVLIYMQSNEIIVLSCTVISNIGYGMAASFTYEGNFIKHIASFAEGQRFRELIAKYFI